ncbi:MAG: restriction endonuclease subunit S [Lactobacillus paragasseri]
MAEWISKTLGEITSFIAKGISPKYVEEKSQDTVQVLNQKCNRNFEISYDESRIHNATIKRVPDDKFLRYGDVLINSTGTGTAGRVAQLFNVPVPTTMDGHMILLRPTDEIEPFYYGYAVKSHQKKIESLAEGSTGQTEINRRRLQEEIVITFPKEKVLQKAIGKFLFQIDEKIRNNKQINNNLEQQISALFINMFGFNIDNLVENKFSLGDLVESVDNRGKTPPLSDKPTSYPIIDVKALSGDIRIVDYNNCTKYVDEETYNNWFRSGHPKQYDILISTVGSLAEMKIFLGDIGCIAQNVVGFRSKGVSPLYLYQYLNYIKSDLVAYNIGSVQPSIKVTHIIKHPIYVAPQDELDKFDSVARSITEKIFANCQENEDLKLLRDTLLPKLMSGELDVSDIDL